MIAIVDYGVGNLFSLSSSLKALGLETVITNDAEQLRAADRIILPGVGAFGDAKAKLDATGLVPVIREEAQKKPLLGICLGMQLLFERSFEFGEKSGLGFIKGSVCPLDEDIPDTLKVPHMGWNALKFKKNDCPLLKDINEGDCVYYVHSFYAKNCDESLAAYSEYDIDIPGAVWDKNVYGTQFHPEKSGFIGSKIIENFINL